MTKQNTELAKKIVDKLAELEAVPLGEGYTVRVPQLGYRADQVKTEQVEIADRDRDGKPIKGGHVEVVDKPAKTTKAEAKELAAADIAKQLDDGVIVLSDSWAADNLS